MPIAFEFRCPGVNKIGFSICSGIFQLLRSSEQDQNPNPEPLYLKSPNPRLTAVDMMTT